MKDVDLLELAYPCAKYCLSRVGAAIEVIKFLDIQDHKDFIRWEDLDVGDIVVWKVPERRREAVVLQVFGTTTITTKVERSSHYGVYEGDGLVSDMVLAYHTHIPHIRMRKCEDCDKPQFVITKILLSV